MKVKQILDMHKWGGSGIEREVFEFIYERFPLGSRILEIGAGHCSTKIFSQFYHLTSIEDNRDYINWYESTYIHAPLVNGWYDIEILKEFLPKGYDLIFLDAPSGEGNRGGFLDNIDLFLNVPVVVHDTNREPERKLAVDIVS